MVLVVVAACGLMAYVATQRAEAEDEVVETVELLDRPTPRETSSSGNQAEEPMERLRVHVVERYPHARDAFTQGLLVRDDTLFESTGMRGQSTVREVDLRTGAVVRQLALPQTLFGEGLAWAGDHFVQLTWTAGRALVYSDGFEKLREFDYEGEGWGLCFNGEHLVMSDGSAELSFRDPETFEVVRRVEVTKRGRPQRNLNELECVGDDLYANVWQTNEIVRIDPSSGRVTARIDARGLLSREERRGADVLNGIAYLPSRERFLLTGKYWPVMFEVEFRPADE